MADQTTIYDGKVLAVSLNAMRVMAAQFFGVDHRYPKNSTLNEQLDINSSTTPDADTRSTLSYIALGYGGLKTVLGPDSVVKVPKPIRHLPTDSGIFKAVPWVLRPVDNDLTSTERADYAFRTKVEYDGRSYWAYYLKRIDKRGLATVDTKTVVSGSTEKTSEFEYTADNLKPTPTELPDYDYETASSVSTPDGTYVDSTVSYTYTFTTFDIEEYQNVASVIFGDASLAIISEMLLCTGVDGAAEGASTTGSSFTYQEAFGVQWAIALGFYKDISITNASAGYKFKIGQAEPFFVGTPDTE